MKQWFRKIGYKIAGWMYGRYGNDELTYVLLFTAIACLLISYLPIPFFFLFSILSYAAIFFSVFRTLSKNLPKRKRELECYLRIKNKPKNTELVLTGRNMPQILTEYADYVSEIKCVKHPYQNGVDARCGIDF